MGKKSYENGRHRWREESGSMWKKNSFQKEYSVAVARKTHFSKKNTVSTEGYENEVFIREEGVARKEFLVWRCKLCLENIRKRCSFFFSCFRIWAKTFLPSCVFEAASPWLRHRNRMLWEISKKTCNYSNMIRHQLCSSLTLTYCCHPAALIFLISRPFNSF